MINDWSRIRREVQALRDLEAARPIIVLCGGCGGRLRLNLSVFHYLSNKRLRCPRCQQEVGCLELMLA